MMGQIGDALIAHSIALSTAMTALFAFVGAGVGWKSRPTTYAMYFAVAGGVAALGVMSAFRLGAKLGL